LTAKRAIQFAMFILILVGLCGLSTWASYAYLSENVILEAAAIALSWGVILLILYIGFKNLTGNGGDKRLSFKQQSHNKLIVIFPILAKICAFHNSLDFKAHLLI